MDIIRIVRFVVLSISVVSFMGCSTNEMNWYSLEGKTMGSTYHIQYHGLKDYQKDIDKLLHEIDNAASTYSETSVISKFNASGSLSIPMTEEHTFRNKADKHFFALIERAHEVYKATKGFFDPTVGPLVEAWGFGSAGKREQRPDSNQINALMSKIGMEYIQLKTTPDTFYILTERPGIKLDFNALAAGYASDEVTYLLLAHGIEDAFVEITGEIKVSGKSPRGDDWIAGVNVPEEDASLHAVRARIRLRNSGMATSGNYRNFYMLDGRKVWHTINPKTGYPQETNLLSATIVHRQCVIADALATACMTQDVDSAIGLVREVEGAAGYFIYRDQRDSIASFVTDNLSKYLLKE